MVFPFMVLPSFSLSLLLLNYILEIESRSKPLESKADDPVRYSCRSHMGYLAENETFQERLIQDFEM